MKKYFIYIRLVIWSNVMIGDSVTKPTIYRDIVSAPLDMLGCGYPVNCGYYSYPYGRLQPIADDSFYKVEHKNDRESKSTIKNGAKILAFCLALGMIPIIAKHLKKCGGLKGYISNAWNKLIGKASP